MVIVELGLHRLSAGLGVSAFLVIADVPVLVDTGLRGWGKSVLRQLRAIGTMPEWIVLTHGDPDHLGNVDLIRQATGARVCAAADERPVIERTIIATNWARATLMALLAPPGPFVDRWLGDGDRIGGVEVIATPGHTPGHVALRWGDALIVGDAFVTGDRARESPALLNMDRDLARTSVKRLANLDIDLAVSSHGRPMLNAARRTQALVDTWS